jgi:hypothetical protein
MRFKPDRPNTRGERRTKRAFLWLPKLIGDEWRWLEMASWVEEAKSDYAAFCVPVPPPSIADLIYPLKWQAVEWT